MCARILPTTPDQTAVEFTGISQAEAEARYVVGQDNSIVFKEGRSRRDIVREAILNVYTFDLLGVAVVFWLLKQPFSALFSIVIMVLLFSYNIYRAFEAKSELNELLELTQPEASVIRSSRLRAIDPDEIVPGDAVVVGPGDQFFADGRLLSSDSITVNESWVTRNLQPRALQQNDNVFAGSYCLLGHGIYEAESVGDERRVTAILEDSANREKPLTPLQSLIRRVLLWLRILVVIFGASFIVRYYFLGADPAFRPTFENGLSIILSLAPGGIYFTILLTYIIGSSELAGAGAVVPRAETIEALAQTDILALGKGGTLTGTLVEFRAIEEAGDEDVFSESHVRQILGDFSRSTRSRSKLMRAMKASFDGTKRSPKQDVLFLSIAGWQGIVFEDDDLNGTFVLGLERALSAHLDWGKVEASGDGKDEPDVVDDAALTELLFAYAPQLTSLQYRNGRPRLPERLLPLGHILFSEEVRPDAQQSVSAFSDAGITLKILSSESAENVLAMSHEVGLDNPDGSPPDHISGPALAELSPQEFETAAANSVLFSGLLPKQKGEIIRSLKGQGALVTMVGDSVADLDGQIEASLSVTFRDSSQAALSIADMILLDERLSALPKILALGQSFFSRLLDILKLTLTHALTAVLLTSVAILAGTDYFPYLPGQNFLITIITITIPAIGLSLWSEPDRVRTSDLGRRLAFFILPAALTIAVVVLGTHILIQNLTSDNYYSRVVVTHLLVGCGLLLVVFVQPPTPFWVGGDTLSGNSRPAKLALGLWFVFMIVTIAPFSSRWLGVQTLRQGEHYLLVVAILAVWVVVLRAIWRAEWVRSLAEIPTPDGPPTG